MDKALAFFQVQDKPGIIEIEIAADSTVGDIVDEIAKHGVNAPPDTFFSIDEEDEAYEAEDRKKKVKGIKRGCRVHLSRCKKIAVSVNFLDRTIDHKFAPGTRVRKVKAWAVEKLRLDPKDAGEHVLRICGTTREPATDTPLHELTNANECSVCFDLVPVKRVEG